MHLDLFKHLFEFEGEAICKKDWEKRLDFSSFKCMVRYSNPVFNAIQELFQCTNHPDENDLSKIKVTIKD